jgi:hypothetical protein
MSDEEFLAAFESGTLAKAEWTHQAHVRMAWLYLDRLPFDQALICIRDGVRRHNAAVGSPPTAYHETITAAFAKLIHARRTEAAAEEDFAEFAVRNADLLGRGLAALRRHYTQGLLDTPAARERFLEPDLEPLSVAHDSLPSQDQ